MASFSSTSEEYVLEMLLPDLEADGYDVFVQPSFALLPKFMQGYRPDAIALRHDKNIAIEVKSMMRPGHENLAKLQGIFDGQPGWELRVIYAPPRRADSIGGVPPTREALVATLQSLPGIFESAGPVPALLTAWAAFEAAARLLLPARLERLQPAGHLVDILASDGVITPTESRIVREISQLRNRAAHGDFNVDFGPGQLAALVGVVKSILEMPPEREAA